MRILVVEDTLSLQELLTAHLRHRGFTVDATASGAEALALAGAAQYDAVILDLGLPDMDGLDVLRQLRAGACAGLPALILTARDSVAERVAGLDAGADDYILKPFETDELDARLRAVLRRPGARLHPVHRYADLAFDSANRTASRHDVPIDLTPREAALFELLMRAGNATVVRDALAERLYGLGEDVTGNALEAIVSRLRRKLAAAGSDVRVETMRGIGYRLAEKEKGLLS
jgi:DNA-binding response OmpR family regulator